MRIIAGERRGQKLFSPRDKNTRPTSDLVREAIFNILGAEIDGLRVIDLFAGTGALGLEALSRGASHALFIERNRSNVGVIAQNLAALRYEHRGTVLAADAFRWAGRDRVLAFEDALKPAIVFLDPPYAEYENHRGRMSKLVESVSAKLPPGSAIVLEAGAHQLEHVITNRRQWDVRKYGGTGVGIHRTGPAAQAADPEPAESLEPRERESAASTHV